jgi:HPt (histidine-containing phosphotransfer) domain-containing protein
MPATAGQQWLIEVEDPGRKALVTGYLERRRAQLAVLHGALAGSDFEALWIAGHRMHGAGGSYGLPRISELGAALELAAFERDVPGIRASLDQLGAFLERVAIVTAEP